MGQQFTNNARALVLTAISAIDTTILITSLLADSFPTANTNGAAVGPATSWFKATLEDSAGNIEIVYVRTRAGGSNVFSNVQRGQEGTSARAFGAGSIVSLRLTAADHTAMRELVDGAVQAVAIALSTGAASVGADDSASGTRFTTVQGGINVGGLFLQAGTDAVTRTSQDKNRDHVHCKDFDILGAGADETLKMLAAMTICRSLGKTLEIEGDILFVAATVPAGFKTAGYGGDYVPGCSMVAHNRATLTIQGKIGINTTGITRTRIGGFKVVTTSRELTETEQENGAPFVFAALSGTKQSAIYFDLEIAPTVTNLTGAYRAGALIQEYGVANLRVDNLKAANATRVFTAYNSSYASVRDVFTTNTECGVYLSTVDKYVVHGIVLVNTSAQYNKWVGRTAGSPRLSNGMDALLVELGNHGTVSGIDAEWPIERAAYVQSSNIQMSSSKVLNGDGFKCVGTDRDHVAENVVAENLHLSLDSTYALGTGRVAPSTMTTYYSNNVKVMGSTATAHAPTQLVLLGVLNFGGYPHTINKILMKDCHAVNAQSLAYGILMPQTAAELLAIDPAQTFLVVTGGPIMENCTLVKNQVRLNGALLHWRDNEASADAKLAYAGSGFRARNNVVTPNASGGQDDWLFDVRYMDNAITEGNKCALPFSSSFFLTAVTAPYQDILMREHDLKFNANTSDLVARLANLNAIRGTELTFHSQVADTLAASVNVKLATNGAVSTGGKTISLDGKGYWLHNAAIECGISMTAAGGIYFGNILAGVKNDLLGSTPPFTITPSAGDLQIRGDLAPTVRWKAELSIL